MRIQWQDMVGYQYQIDSDSPDLIAIWLKELIIKYKPMLENTSYPPPRLWFFPSGNYDSRVWSQPRDMTVERLQWIIQGFEEMGK